MMVNLEVQYVADILQIPSFTDNTFHISQKLQNIDSLHSLESRPPKSSFFFFIHSVMLRPCGNDLLIFYIVYSRILISASFGLSTRLEPFVKPPNVGSSVLFALYIGKDLLDFLCIV